MACCITVFGATGFIGRHLLSLLLQSGATVRVAARHRGLVNIAATKFRFFRTGRNPSRATGVAAQSAIDA